MALWSRVGNGLLLAGSLALAGLMVYTLRLAPERVAARRVAGNAEVAVVVPERDDWLDIRQGLLACRRRGVVPIREDGPDAVTIATPGGRRVRFGWEPARGAIETRAAAARLMHRPGPPVAVIGSANTALTVALAAALREAVGPGPNGPVLLVPWATATRVHKPGAPGGIIPLLDLYPGCTFRFSPDNDRMADLLVHCLLDREPGRPPARVAIVEDPADPYSEDLADGFRRAIRAAAPLAPIVAKADAAFSPGLAEVPGPPEDRCAEWAWRLIREAPPGRATWLVLPLQGDPIRRILRALEALAPPDVPEGALQVLCGDGIGQATLQQFAGLRGFSIWCVSSDAAPGTGPPGIARADLIAAEMVLALALALDRAAARRSEDLRQAVLGLDLTASDPAAMGRPLAFDASGERRAGDPGHVLAIRPGWERVHALRLGPDGRWTRPAPVEPPTPTARAWP